jgi:hypothetical protein
MASGNRTARVREIPLIVARAFRRIRFESESGLRFPRRAIDGFHGRGLQVFHGPSDGRQQVLCQLQLTSICYI